MGKTLMLGLAALTGAALVLSGCSAPAAPGEGPDTAPAPAAAAASATPAPPQAPADGASAGAPPAAVMVCGDEIRARIAQILALPSAPAGASAWADGLYTCSYRLPAGTLVLSVKESPDSGAARAWAAGLRIPGAAPIEGLSNLGLPSYQSAAGIAVFVKDSFTLTVDATKLGEPIGPDQLSRASLAYQLATDVLACWSG